MFLNKIFLEVFLYTHTGNTQTDTNNVVVFLSSLVSINLFSYVLIFNLCSLFSLYYFFSNDLGITEPVKYGKTQRGRRMLYFEGYRYVENRQSAKNIFWRCSRYVKYGCRATVSTSKEPDKMTIRVTGLTHSHPPESKCDEGLNYKLVTSNAQST